MARRTQLTGLLAALGTLTLAGGAQAQFQNNTADIPSGSPNNASRSENVDFGDVDLDGDWDAVFADGGDADQDQNRIWMNQGGAQAGTTGVFVDETNARFPSINDQSRDIEFADIDNDGDLDLYISNTSAIIVQSNRWWVNTGVGSGVYTDETNTRWVGLGTGNSSVPSGAVLGGGGFRDWSCDCDFGDLDNDGDLDLVHSSYGGAFGGQVPTRIFLNDGAGFFSEFNPSGFQLSGDQISNGNPGLWCEGTQSSDTTNSDGTFCDIASSALDIDIGDIDGDFDLDILHGARQEAPRMFQNRLEENGGVLGFRDVTGATFPGGYTAGNGHYEQEMGDLDGDGDLDIYGLNWVVSGGFNDITLRNDGDGTYSNIVTLSGSGADDNEGDFLDYDQDGDLDLYVCNFSGQDKLYRNNNNGGSGFSFTNVTSSLLPSLFATGLDADACDVDGDGDTDLMVGNDFNAANYYLKNLNNTPDTTASYVPNLEQAPDRVPGPAPTIVRCHVYGNAPYYITWYDPTILRVWVDGVLQAPVTMRSSGGQVFRGEIPGTYSGIVSYQVVTTDENGNVGVSATLQYNASAGGGPGTPSCFGVGCPCANDDPSAGCANSTGSGALLAGSGSTSVTADDLVLTATGIPNNQQGLFYMGDTTVSNQLYDGFQCALGSTFRFLNSIQSSGATGTMTYTGFAADAPAQIVSGTTWRFHCWHRDVPGTPCGTGANFSNLYSVTFTP